MKITRENKRIIERERVRGKPQEDEQNSGIRDNWPNSGVWLEDRQIRS